jgi:protein translocase SEC61 complex gamma subunit
MDESNAQMQAKKPGLFGKIKDKFKQYNRVMSVAHKPDKDELISSMKITGSGIIFLGSIGFIIFLLYFFIVHLATGA